MLGNFELKKEKKEEFTSKKFLEEFYTKPQHQWILKDNDILGQFYPFLLRQDLEKLHKKNTVFLRIKDKVSTTFTPRTDNSYILVFPELYELMKSSCPEFGLAILAHEIGHIIFNHSEKNISSIKAQIEADSYASEVGYGRELIQILGDNIDIEGTKERIIALKKLQK